MCSWKKYVLHDERHLQKTRVPMSTSGIPGLVPYLSAKKNKALVQINNGVQKIGFFSNLQELEHVKSMSRVNFENPLQIGNVTRSISSRSYLLLSGLTEPKFKTTAGPIILEFLKKYKLGYSALLDVYDATCKFQRS